jgi:hypothetical protein
MIPQGCDPDLLCRDLLNSASSSGPSFRIKAEVVDHEGYGREVWRYFVVRAEMLQEQAFREVLPFSLVYTLTRFHPLVREIRLVSIRGGKETAYCEFDDAEKWRFVVQVLDGFQTKGERVYKVELPRLPSEYVDSKEEFEKEFQSVPRFRTLANWKQGFKETGSLELTDHDMLAKVSKLFQDSPTDAVFLVTLVARLRSIIS